MEETGRVGLEAGMKGTADKRTRNGGKNGGGIQSGKGTRRRQVVRQRTSIFNRDA